MHESVETGPNWTSIIRWVLLIPSAIVAWYVAFVLGVISQGIHESACPSEDMLFGMCSGILGKMTINTFIVLFSGISAIFVVAASVMVAPSRKDTVAIVALVCGREYAYARSKIVRLLCARKPPVVRIAV